jgi:hypothetical protein
MRMGSGLGAWGSGQNKNNVGNNILNIARFELPSIWPEPQAPRPEPAP